MKSGTTKENDHVTKWVDSHTDTQNTGNGKQ